MGGGDLDTRTALLDAAEELFAERGYHGAGLRQVVARAGVNLAAVKYHFGSKRALYVETVRHAMVAKGGGSSWELIARPPRSRREAALVLARFVREFLSNVLLRNESRLCARLMLREAMRPSEAIGEVVASFTLPRTRLLESLVAVLAPRAAAEELERTAHSVLGQILHYVIQRPFLERQSALDLASDAGVRRLADHIVRFSLRGLGLSEAFVARALEAADVSPAPEPGPASPREIESLR